MFTNVQYRQIPIYFLFSKNKVIFKRVFVIVEKIYFKDFIKEII